MREYRQTANSLNVSLSLVVVLGAVYSLLCKRQHCFGCRGSQYDLSLYRFLHSISNTPQIGYQKSYDCNLRILFVGVDSRMVYCSKCGALNSDDASVCSNCGAALHGARVENSPYTRHRRMEEEYRDYPRRSGGFAALAIGLIITLIGFSILMSDVYHINIPWWPIILLFVGILIIISGLRARSRWSRRY